MTGVQTCALPISGISRAGQGRRRDIDIVLRHMRASACAVEFVSGHLEGELIGQDVMVTGYWESCCVISQNTSDEWGMEDDVE